MKCFCLGKTYRPTVDLELTRAVLAAKVEQDARTALDAHGHEHVQVEDDRIEDGRLGVVLWPDPALHALRSRLVVLDATLVSYLITISRYTSTEKYKYSTDK